MRVLVLASLFPHLHNETLGLSTCRRTVALARLCATKVVSLRTRGDVPESEVRGGVEVIRPLWRRVPKLGVFLDGYRYAAHAGRAVEGLRAEFDFDLIDAHWLYPDAFAAVRLGQRLGKPVVVTGRGSDVDEFLFRWPVRRFARAALCGAAQIVALTRQHKQRMVEAGAQSERITVIPNGVDTALFRPGDRAAARRALGVPPDGLVLFSAGALVEDKGHHHLIRGLSLLGGEAKARLYIAGTGAYCGTLLRLVESLALRDRVTLLGPLDQQQMPLWYQAADLFCFGSYHEGCPNVVLEAVACGTPAVSTDVGGVPDLVEEGRSGVLFKPRSGEAFAAALRAALARPWDRAQIAALGARRSWAHVAAEYHALFEQVLAAPR